VTQVVTARGDRRFPDGRKLSVDIAGDPEGTPVFLLHGTPGGRNGPRPRGIVLYRLGICLISYDRPGYPGSDRVPDRGVADAAADVKAIAEHFGIKKFSVVGRSGGGPHALACAAILRDRVICAAAIGSLAPCDAEGLDWKFGMAISNAEAYRKAEEDDLGALIAMLKEQADRVRDNSEGLIKLLWPELVGHDKEVIGSRALRRIISQVHADALRESADGWIDDVVALSRPWNFKLSEITVPVKLWTGSDDKFSPASHTYWLAERISRPHLEIGKGAAHFGAVAVLPKILAWVAETADKEQKAGRPADADGGRSVRSPSLAGASPSLV